MPSTFEQKLIYLVHSARSLEVAHEKELEQAGACKDMQQAVEYLEAVMKAWIYAPDDGNDGLEKHQRAEKKRLDVV